MKKIVGGTKDENGAYLPNKPITPPSVDPTTTPYDPVFSDISLDDLTKKQLLILYRETRNLLIESAKGLLSPHASTSFERCMKLTKDLRKEEKAYLDSLSEEELEKVKPL